MTTSVSPGVYVVHHPLIEHCLSQLRDERSGMEQFRKYAKLITQLLCFEATHDLRVEKRRIQTPLEETEGTYLADQVVLVPVLRAGLAMLDIVGTLFPDARVGFVGLEREEVTAIAHGYYHKFPAGLLDSRVVVLDPMLATGGSAVATLELLSQAGARDMRMLCVVVAPEGIELMQQRFPEVAIYTAVVDRALDEHKFILPGLGDFGDRYFGTA